MPHYTNPNRDKIIELIKDGNSFTEVADDLGITRNVVAGIMWRYYHPKMNRKGVPTTAINHRPPYNLR